MSITSRNLLQSLQCLLNFQSFTEKSVLECAFFHPMILLLRLPREHPSHKMLAVLLPKGGSWSLAFHAWTTETGDERAKACVIIWPRFVNIIIYTTLCFMKTYAHLIWKTLTMENSHNAHTKQFFEILETFELKQHFSVRSLDLFCCFTRVYEGHFVLCYKEGF